MSADATTLRLTDLSRHARLGAAASALALTAASLAHFGIGSRGAIAAALCVVLTLLATFDLEHRRIPNRVVLPATGAILAAQLGFFPDHALEWVGAGLGAGALLSLPRLFKADAIGMGDVKLGMLLGVGLGGEIITALFFGSIAAALAAGWILINRGAGARHETIPLGPFLALGGVLALFVGDFPGA